MAPGAWAEKNCSGLGIEAPGTLEETSRPEFGESLEDYLQIIRGKSVYFMGDNLLRTFPGPVSHPLWHDRPGDWHPLHRTSRYQAAWTCPWSITCREMGTPLPKITEKPENYNQIQRIPGRCSPIW
jgi:light-independent protochlorophyllide reductase subunit N